MGKTTRRSAAAAHIRQVHVPCPPPPADHRVRVTVFDAHGLLGDMIEPATMQAEMTRFLTEMKDASGLPAPVKASLAAVQFEVAYVPRRATAAEVGAFGHADFPLHLLTAEGLFQSSAEAVSELLEQHRIPRQTQVVQQLAPILLLDRVRPYETVEKSWETNRSVLGIGVPGQYLIPGSQSRCRKVGVIKMQGFMTENLPFGRRPAKILFVLRHELGHMFALPHTKGTLMDESYDLDLPQRYNNDQLAIVSHALTQLYRQP